MIQISDLVRVLTENVKGLCLMSGTPGRLTLKVKTWHPYTINVYVTGMGAQITEEVFDETFTGTENHRVTHHASLEAYTDHFKATHKFREPHPAHEVLMAAGFMWQMKIGRFVQQTHDFYSRIDGDLTIAFYSDGSKHCEAFDVSGKQVLEMGSTE